MKEQEFSHQERNEQEITEAELLDNEAIEQAYKVQVQADVPDLWNRIEAALPEKTPFVLYDHVEETQTKEQVHEQVRKGKILTFRTIRTIALIAACLLIAIMIPTLLSVGGRNYESAAPAADAAASAPMEEYAAAEEAAPVAEEAAPAAAEETEQMEEQAAAQEAVPAAADEAAAEEAVAGESAEDSSGSDVMYANSLKAEQDEESEKRSERNDYGSDALYTTDVEVEIIACDTALGRNDEDGYCTCTIMILKDASGMYEEAATMDVYVDETEAKQIKAGDQIKVTLVNSDPLSSTEPKISMILE